MKSKSYRSWVVAGISIAITGAAFHLSEAPAGSALGVAVPRSVAMTLRGGDPEPVCHWVKSAECKQVVQSSNLTTCPAQTYYSSSSEGTEYGKTGATAYCGTQREGDATVYDCTMVVTDIDGCVK